MIEPGQPDRDSLEYQDAFHTANLAIGNDIVKPYSRDVVAAVLEVLADYAIKPGDAESAARFIELATAAATSARDATT